VWFRWVGTATAYRFGRGVREPLIGVLSPTPGTGLRVVGGSQWFQRIGTTLSVPLDEFENAPTVAFNRAIDVVGRRARMRLQVLADVPRQLVLVGVDSQGASLGVEAEGELEGPGGLGFAVLGF
jgi:hypothetical protein